MPQRRLQGDTETPARGGPEERGRRPLQPVAHVVRRAFVVAAKGALNKSKKWAHPGRDFILRPLLRYRGFLWFVSTPFFLMVVILAGVLARFVAPGLSFHLLLTWPLVWTVLQVVVLALASFLSSRYVFVTRPARPGERDGRAKIVMVRKPQRSSREYSFSGTMRRLKPTRQLLRWDFLGVSASWLFGKLMQFPIPTPLRWAVYTAWGRAVGADLSECELPLDHYRSLNALFTRRLKAGARTVPSGPSAPPLVSPVDGVVVTAGVVVGDRLDQVKGVTYSIEQFLGECLASAQRYGNAPIGAADSEAHGAGSPQGATAGPNSVQPSPGETFPPPSALGSRMSGSSFGAGTPGFGSPGHAGVGDGWRVAAQKGGRDTPVGGRVMTPSAAAATAAAATSVAGTATIVSEWSDSSMEALSLPDTEEGEGWSPEDEAAEAARESAAASHPAQNAAGVGQKRKSSSPKRVGSPLPGKGGLDGQPALSPSTKRKGASGGSSPNTQAADDGAARPPLTAEALLASQTKALYHVVIYLAPHDYHRVHAAADATIRSVRHFPGTLFPINPAVARMIPNLFALNERVVMLGAWSGGFYSQAFVGAYNVGSITLDFDSSIVTNTLRRDCVNPNLELFSVDGVGCYCYETHYSQGVKLAKGDEVGRFNLGSTVVLVFEGGSDFELLVKGGDKVRMGQPLCREKGSA